MGKGLDLERLMEEIQKYHLEAKDFIKAEVNLLVLPFFSLEKRPALEPITVQFYNEGFLARWKVSPNPEYGWPTPQDRIIHRALEHLLLKKRPLQREFPFSLYAIAKEARLKNDGRNIMRIKRSLIKVSATMIESVKAYRYKQGDEIAYVEQHPFTLYEVYFRGEYYKGRLLRSHNLLVLHNAYFKALESSYTKPLDWDYYLTLSPTAQRLYELLGVKFYGMWLKREPLRFNYRTLCQLLPMRPQRYPSKAKERLEPAHQELLKTDFLSEVEWEIDDGQIYLNYWPGARYWAEAQLSQNKEHKTRWL